MTRPPPCVLRLALAPWVFAMASTLSLGVYTLFLGASMLILGAFALLPAAAADPASSNGLRGAEVVAPQSCERLIEENRVRWPADLPDALEESRKLYLMGQCH